VQLVSQPAAFTDFQWAYVQKLAHALCIRHTNAAKSLTAQLLAGQANPEDNISKLLLALLRLYRSFAGARGFEATAAAAAAEPAGSAEGLDDSTLSEQRQDALVLVLQEWLGSLVQRFYGKQTPENNDRYYTSILTYVPIAAIFTNSSDKDSAEAGANRLAFDPLQQLSPLETADASTIAAGGPLPAGIRPDWLDTILQGLLGAHAGIPAHPVLGQFLLGAGRLLALLLPLEAAESTAAQAAVKASIPSNRRATSDRIESALSGSVAALDSCWPQWKQAVLEALLLRFRTARYSCKLAEQLPEGSNHSFAAPAPAAPAKMQWEAVQLAPCLSLAVERLQEACAPQLKSYRQGRLEEAKQQLLQVTANVLRRHEGNADKACAVIQKVQLLVRGTSGKDADHTVAGSSCASSSGPTARLLNVAYTLQRTDVPALLELLCAVPGAQPTGNKSPQHTEDVVSIGAVTPGLLRMLVLGPWCTQPAQVFRNSQIVQQLCAHFGSECEDLLEAVHCMVRRCAVGRLGPTGMATVRTCRSQVQTSGRRLTQKHGSRPLLKSHRGSKSRCDQCYRP
jgi:hypothetical protein